VKLLRLLAAQLFAATFVLAALLEVYNEYLDRQLAA
jgi:hypothetical protein